MIYHDKNPLDTASTYSQIMFSWAYPLIRFAKTEQLNIEMMGKVRAEDRVELQLKNLEESWAAHKLDKDNALFTAVFNANKHEYKVAMFW